MGMSPRIKWKKGRYGNFGADVVVTIQTSSGDLFPPFTVSGTAIDPEFGDVSAHLVWYADSPTNDGSPPDFPLAPLLDRVVGNGANPNLSFIGDPIGIQYRLYAYIPGQTQTPPFISIKVR